MVFIHKSFKGSSEFYVSEEPSVIPAWIAFENFPVHFFSKNVLFSLALMVGKLLKLDEATTLLSRPSVAHVCFEIDVVKELVSHVLIGRPEGGYYQYIYLERTTVTFFFCRMLGHSKDTFKYTSGSPQLILPMLRLPMQTLPFQLLIRNVQHFGSRRGRGTLTSSHHLLLLVFFIVQKRKLRLLHFWKNQQHLYRI